MGETAQKENPVTIIENDELHRYLAESHCAEAGAGALNVGASRSLDKHVVNR